MADPRPHNERVNTDVTDATDASQSFYSAASATSSAATISAPIHQNQGEMENIATDVESPRGVDTDDASRSTSDQTHAQDTSAKSQDLDKDPNLVEWEEGDPDNPQNWSNTRKVILTITCALLTLNVTFASSAPSSGTMLVAKEFNISSEVAVLLTSLFLVGYCFGPLVWAPLSEVFGRRPLFIIAFFIYTAFQAGSAAGTNIQTVLITRFLAGFFGSSPLTNCGGVSMPRVSS